MARAVTKWKPASDASRLRRRSRVLTAAAQNIDLTSREDAQRQRLLRQNWQLMAWTFYDSVPEVGFGMDFRAHSAARMRLFVAALLEDGETDDPVAIDNPDLGAPELVIEACQNALRDLGNGKVALSNIMESLSINVSVAGEAFLLGQEDPLTGIVTWTIRSIEEIVIYDDKVMLREGPMTNQGFLGLIPLDPEFTYVRRMWKPHPRFRLLAQSEMRRLANTCEDLLILRRIIRATGRQPTAINDLNDVFIPRAAIAVTRHQRETSFATAITGLPRSPKLFRTTRAAQPIRNSGTGGLGPAPPAFTRNAIAKTTGSSIVTRSSLT